MGRRSYPKTETGPQALHRPVVRNVVMEKPAIRQTPRVLNVIGFPGAEIRGMRIQNSTFNPVAKPDVVKAGGVKLADCFVERTN